MAKQRQVRFRHRFETCFLPSAPTLCNRPPARGPQKQLLNVWEQDKSRAAAPIAIAKNETGVIYNLQ